MYNPCSLKLAENDTRKDTKPRFKSRQKLQNGITHIHPPSHWIYDSNKQRSNCVPLLQQAGRWHW